MSIPYTKAAERSMQEAFKIAKRLNHDCVGSEHLLLGILIDGNNAAAKVLERNGVQKDRIETIIANSIASSGTVATKSRYNYTYMYQKILEQSEAEAVRTRCDKIGTEHFLLAILLILL